VRCAGREIKLLDFGIDVFKGADGGIVVRQTNRSRCISWVYANLLANGSGALGSFTYSVAGPQGFGGENNFLPFLDSGDDGFQIYALSPVLGSPTRVAPSFAGIADLYACETVTCLTDFAPAIYQGERPPVLGIFLSGPAVIRVKAIPEPVTLSLLVWGLLALRLAVASKKFRAFES
jgi:hypothetical protein